MQGGVTHCQFSQVRLDYRKFGNHWSMIHRLCWLSCTRGKIHTGERSLFSSTTFLSDISHASKEILASIQRVLLAYLYQLRV